MLTIDLFTARSNLLPQSFVWAIYIYIGSIEVTCRSTVAKIVLIGNLRWSPSCLCLLYFPATVLFTCIKSWFFRNDLANFHQISHWSYYWNVIDSLFKWSLSIDYQAHIFFFKIKNCSNYDLFISCDDRIGKMLHNICISAVAMTLRWASRGSWASCSQGSFLLIPVLLLGTPKAALNTIIQHIYWFMVYRMRHKYCKYLNIYWTKKKLSRDFNGTVSTYVYINSFYSYLLLHNNFKTIQQSSFTVWKLSISLDFSISFEIGDDSIFFGL